MDPSRAKHARQTAVVVDEMMRASREVDLSLLRWFLSLTPRERLRAATRTSRMLDRFRRDGASEAS